MGRPKEPFRDLARDRRGEGAREQERGGVSVQAAHDQLRQSALLERIGFRFTYREEQGDGVGVEAPGGEEQRGARGGVEPLGVVDDDEHRPHLGRHAQHAERRRRDREGVTGWARAEGERAREGLSLRRGQLVEAVEHGPK